MAKVYIYVLNTLADWEIGYLTAELNSGRFFKKGAVKPELHFVGASKEPVTTMGGIRIVPDCTVEEIEETRDTVLILPGADTWGDPANRAVIAKVVNLLEQGAVVAAICGATVSLAAAGLLDMRNHTSNGAGFLEMFVPTYKGTAYYVDAPAVTDGNLVTAAGTGALSWTKQLLLKLEVFGEEAADAWEQYFGTGNAMAFYRLMELSGK